MAPPKVEIKGLQPVLQKLGRLEPKVSKRLLRTTLRKGAKVFQQAAKSNAPRDTGALRRGIRVRALKRSRRRIGVNVWTPTRAKLGIPLGASGYYPATIEYGSAKRNIPPQNYMLRAFLQKSAAVEALIARDLATAIRSAV